MTAPRRSLGDSHNFGRRVSLAGERVVKPRTLFWEWLVLARDSPLRQFLSSAALQAGLGDAAFRFLPELKFYPQEVGGEVERISLTPVTLPAREERQLDLARIVGRSLAFWSWLGVSDLHWENLVLGQDCEGNLVFGPLDIEMMLAELWLPTETKLLPDADPEYAAVCRHACGVRRVLPYLGKPLSATALLEVIGAYRKMLAFLDQRASQIAQVLASLPGLREAPLRVLLRGTDEYVLRDRRSLWPPLLNAELEQLDRGDIPYFFRLYGRPGIHYYGDPSLRTIKTLPQKGDVPQLDAMLPISRGLQSSSRKKLREEGPFTIVGAFDHVSLTGRYRSEDLELALSARKISLKFPDGEELQARRDVSAFVSSVYLPCSCGEVSSVLVPPVTRCEA